MKFANPFIAAYGAPTRPDTEAQTQPDNITSFALSEDELAFIHAIDSSTYAAQEAYTLGLRTVSEIFEKNTARINQQRQRFLNNLIDKHVPGGTVRDHDVNISLADKIVTLEPHKKEINTTATNTLSNQMKSALQSALTPSKATPEELQSKAVEIIAKLSKSSGSIPDDILAAEITKGLGIKDQASAMSLIKDIFSLQPLDPDKYSPDKATSAMVVNMHATIKMYSESNKIDPGKYTNSKHKAKLMDIVLDCFSIPKEILEELKKAGKQVSITPGQDPGSFLRKFLINTINMAFP